MTSPPFFFSFPVLPALTCHSCLCPSSSWSRLTSFLSLLLFFFLSLYRLFARLPLLSGLDVSSCTPFEPDGTFFLTGLTTNSTGLKEVSNFLIFFIFKFQGAVKSQHQKPPSLSPPTASQHAAFTAGLRGGIPNSFAGSVLGQKNPLQQQLHFCQESLLLSMFSAFHVHMKLVISLTGPIIHPPPPLPPPPPLLASP